MKDKNLTRYNPSQQLEFLRHKSRKLGLILYGVEENYLKVLRSILPASIKDSLFLLITDRGQNLLDGISKETREKFQLKVEELINQCCSFLTIEQLISFSVEIQRDEKIKRERVREEFLSAMSNSQQSIKEPYGSVSLEMNSPLDNPYYVDGFISSSLQGDVDLGAKNNAVDLNEGNSNKQIIEGNPSKSSVQKEENSSLDVIKDKKKDLDILQSLFLMARDSFRKGAQSDQSANPIDQEDRDLLNKVNSNESKESFLPVTPLELAQWMDSIEFALNRRLLDLSHSLNIELLRAGLVNNLLPMSLLEAALKGQLETQSSPSNLLRIRIPFRNAIAEEDLVEVIGVSIRPSELEFDNFHLRRCRTLIKQHQRPLLVMVKQQRHWQSRQMVQEAHQTWWQP